ncbi:unnamed protein product [Moneuplotes crassus]|uniref:Uncharacterized protein n=1 Tax=Euplotes crassus TaxID=5936 RepID=A0AAD1XJM8_EUPCR|nr:unnamed protein product [Moneuplotes crassus]
MCDILKHNEVYIVDNSPEYQDSLDIKIDIYSDDEYEQHLRSKDTHCSSKEVSTKPVISVSQPVEKQAPTSLEQRVNDRVRNAYSRLLQRERIGNPLRSEQFISSKEEVLEFMKVLSNGAKCTNVVQPKRKRGRPRKYPLKEKPAPKRRGRKPSKPKF